MDSTHFLPENPDWRTIFGNDRPLRVEIGPGKGEFLIESACRESEANYIGIEIRSRRVEKIRNKIARSNLKNVQVYLGDARAMPRLFGKNSVEAFFIHFPDPWPKRRHQHRRLIVADFVRSLYELLQPQGKIYLTTDVEGYAITMLQLFTEHKGFKSLYAKFGDFDFSYHRSIHERKFKLQKRTIYYFCYSKE